MKTTNELLKWGRDDLPGLVNYCLELQEQCSQLSQQQSLNSTNSSKPPATDGYQKPKPKSQRASTGKKSGGQPGHPGHHLKPVSDPDSIVPNPLTICPCGCGSDLTKHPVICQETRQVFDIPEQKYHVTEYMIEFKICPTTGLEVKSSWPEDVDAPVQYGRRLRACLTYLSVQQLLPLARISQMCADLFGLPVSEASIQAAIKSTEKSLIPFSQAVIKHIQQSPVVNVDESGLRINQKLNWLHIVCSKSATWYGVHAKRGQEAIKDFAFLLAYQGTLIHDCWAPYFELACKHGLCNAHILRELTFVHEELDQSWAAKLHQLLLDMNQDVMDHKNRNTNLTPKELARRRRRYRKLLQEGRDANPLNPPPVVKKRGRKKQTKTQNLLDRLEKYEAYVLAFLHDFNIPFTNNQAEQDIRMNKVKQKVSGCFRTLHGAESFLSIRSYVSTVRKCGHQVFPALLAAISGSPIIPDFTNA